jgi:hypothetical protein
MSATRAIAVSVWGPEKGTEAPAGATLRMGSGLSGGGPGDRIQQAVFESAVIALGHDVANAA